MLGIIFYTVYNDAKRGTLSAFSWPSRVIAIETLVQNSTLTQSSLTMNRTTFVMLTPSVIGNF